MDVDTLYTYLRLKTSQICKTDLSLQSCRNILHEAFTDEDDIKICCQRALDLIREYIIGLDDLATESSSPSFEEMCKGSIGKMSPLPYKGAIIERCYETDGLRGPALTKRVEYYTTEQIVALGHLKSAIEQYA